MAITLVRTVILYILVTLAVRIMGKRQIGELQPSELVTTILLSELAAIPMQDNDIPIFNAFISIAVLLGLEVISSVLEMKSSLFRRAVEGNPVVVINEGVIIEKALKKLRYTADDLMEALRQKDIFDLKEVECAIVETNGALSVMQKAGKKPLTPEDMDIKTDNSGTPWVIISDGNPVTQNFQNCNMTERKLNVLLKGENKEMKDILLMTMDKKGNKVIIDKKI